MIDESFYHAPGAPLDNKTDYLVRATALNGHVRAFAIRTTETVREAMRIRISGSMAKSVRMILTAWPMI